MQRTLWLIRHAKAENPSLGQSDQDRALAAQGVADLDATVNHLAAENLAPVQWLWTSAAVRTRQTAKPLAKLWQCQVIAEASLYAADPWALLDCLQGTPADCVHGALVGHNPGISQLAHYITDPTDQRALNPDLPTLGAVHLTFDGHWHELCAGACSLLHDVTPRFLRGGC